MSEFVRQKPLLRGKRVKKSLPNSLSQHDGSVAKFPRERFLHFCSQLKIQSRDYGLIPFNLLGSQLYILDEICSGLDEGITNFVILKDRQSGVSTLCLALDLFWAFEYKGTLGVFCTHEEGARDQFRAQIDLYLATLPKKFRVAASTNNRLMLVLDNSSLFRYLVAGQRTTTNKLGRSGGTNFAHMTEVAFYGSPDDIASLLQTFSPIYKHRLYIMESTANGFNHYEEIWRTAIDSPTQRAIFSGWWRDERKEFGESHPSYRHYMPQGVASALDKHEREFVANVKAQYGVEINAGQIAWYRWHLENNCHGDLQQMLQEQPSTPDDAFQSTGAKYFVNESLTRMFKQARESKCLAFAIKITDRWQDMELRPLGERAVHMAQLKIWQEPSRWGRYAIGVDVAYGSSPDNDLTVISVWRCWADRCVQVAEYATAEISTYQCAWVVAYLGGLYKDCMVNIEVTGPGTDVLKELDRVRQWAREMTGPEGADLRNVHARMREFLYRRADSLTGGVVRQWKTSPGASGTKVLLMSRYKNYVELDIAQPKSLALIEEMRRIRIDGGSIEAESGHDDRVVAGALAVYAWGEWRLPELRAAGWTYDRAQAIERQGGEEPMDGLVRRWMQTQKIQVKDVVEMDVRTA
jgi:hypothetical protein